MRSFHTLEYCSALKRKAVLTPVTTKINPEDVMLSETSKSQQKQTPCDPLAYGRPRAAGAENGRPRVRKTESPGARLHDNVNMLNTTAHSEMVTMVNFTLGFFYSNKKKSYHNND